MKKRLLFGCFPLVLLVAAGLWWGLGRGSKGARGAALPDRIETVNRGEVAIKVTETGTLAPLRSVEVKSKVAGRVTRLLADEGARVRAGQLLVLIDPTEINSQVAQMQAQMDAARARFRQSERGALYQADQTGTGITQAEEGLRVAQARLAQARTELRVQPVRTRSEIAQAEAALASAKSSLALLQGATQPQAAIAASGGLDEAEAALAEARANVARNERLLAKGFVAQQALDSAKTQMAAAVSRRDQAKSRQDLLASQNALEVAQARNRVAEARATLDRAQAERATETRSDDVRSAEAAVRQARAQLLSARSSGRQNLMRLDDVAQARAQVTQLENSLREIAVRQNDTRLLAPMSGVVTRRYVEEGELITSGVSAFSAGQAVLQIADLSRMRVTLSVNEVDVQRLRPGQAAEIAVDGARGVTFAGHVRKVAPAAQGAGGSNDAAARAAAGNGGVIRFAVEVLLDRPDARLRPGMSARCTVLIARRKNALRLPVACVKGDGKNAAVEVLTPGGDPKTPQFTKRTVTAGLRGDSHVEIVSGLKEDDKVKQTPFSGPPRKGLNIGISAD